MLTVNYDLLLLVALKRTETLQGFVTLFGLSIMIVSNIFSKPPVTQSVVQKYMN